MKDDIKKTHKLIQKAYHYYHNPIAANAVVLHLDVAKGNIEKALFIFDALICGLESRGHQIEIIENKTYTIVHDKKIEISIREKKRKEVKGNSYSGQLIVRINHRAYSFGIKEFIDSPYNPLSNRLSEIIAHIELKAESLIQEEIERIAEERANIVAAERKVSVSDSTFGNINLSYDLHDLLDLSQKHCQAKMIQEFINDYIQALIKNNALDEEKLKWIKWANEQAEKHYIN